jgi:O-antigen/teichoic acid export membrane protein
MSDSRLQTATRIVRNSMVLFVVAVMAKGFGLIIAVVVARYLGPEALGVYAVLMAVTMLLEMIAPLGQQDVVIRAVAREPSSMLRQWVEAGVTAVFVASLSSVGLALGGRALGLAPDVQLAVDVVALSLPFGSASFVAQSVLQGLERLKFLAIATFVGRVLSLVVLIAMIHMGSGVVSAFASRMVFHVLTLGILIVVILQRGRAIGAATDWRLAPRHLAARAASALPFAAQRVLSEASIRGNLLVLPFLISMQQVGLFDAADRIRQAVAMIMPIVMLSILPTFSRTFRANPAKGAMLATYSMKFLMIAVLPMAFLVAVAAPRIIRLLYDTGYDSSVPLLQIVIWAQVFLSADMILKQAMIATDNEVAMLRRSTAALLVQITATVSLVTFFGIRGVAVAMVVTSIFIVAIDVHFVRRNIAKIDFFGAVAKPLVCAAAAAGAALALGHRHLVLLGAAAGITYLAALFLLRTFSADELTLIHNIPRHLLKKSN